MHWHAAKVLRQRTVRGNKHQYCGEDGVFPNSRDKAKPSQQAVTLHLPQLAQQLGAVAGSPL